MYKHYDPLTEAEVDALLALKESVAFKDSYGPRCRMGANGNKAESIYNYSKWFSWTEDQRRVFRSAFSDVTLSRMVQGWFLELPTHTGFLDRMTRWVNSPHAGTIIATALKDQHIYLDDKLVDVKRGQQIGFHLSTVHHIKPTAEGQLWACAMVRGLYEVFR